jgi:ribonuclease HI
MKYYAVKVGRKTGVFNNWEECKEQVEGFENAEYKSFSKLEDANNFLVEQQQLNLEVDGPIAYVD